MKPSDISLRDTNICAKATAKGKVMINTKGRPQRRIKRRLGRGTQVMVMPVVKASCRYTHVLTGTLNYLFLGFCIYLLNILHIY